MIAILMLLSFAVPLAGALMIRRYSWIGVCAVMAMIVATPVIQKLVSSSYDPMGWGFALVLVFWPAAIGVSLGALITALRRWRAGPGDLTLLNISLALILSVASLSFGLLVASDF